jgi:soluble lytic murein transglycosylase-like protein
MSNKELPIEEGLASNFGKAALFAAAATAAIDYTPKNQESREVTALTQGPEYEQKFKAAKELEMERLHQAAQQKKINRLASITTKIFKHVDPSDAHHYASLAVKYAHPTFPTAEDLMASMSQESTMRHNALSNRGAYGLMQVVPSAWKIKYSDLDTPEKQVMHGSNAMREYYKKYKNPSITLQAYNMGPANINSGNMNEPYAKNHATYKKKYMEGIEKD